MLTSCKYWLYRDPAILEAWAAYRHWDRGQLQLLYPRGAPLALLRAIEGIDAGYNTGQSERIKDAGKRDKASI